MDPYSGFLMFHWALGVSGVYFLIASLVARDNGTHEAFRWYQIGFFAVLAAFMFSGLYFYNIPPIG